ncbi:GpE family phage tail protein [Pectobacteriaceae bacterium CE90]|nr:GpE family phage tail protein [Prodigiosinella sp. LS101]WJV52749.1 GpE family phage tail protein [Prodigiosinella sp. LS101]WJV57104.1 GpE family phage tail protein [Pectobacteriaceae bacterium C111]WJY16813.1 GpE family phage tail protein [Pectobacteriaceae bacterium CE90]
MEAQSMLARWWRWQPSELDALPVDELEDWLDIASIQIKRENGDSD